MAIAEERQMGWGSAARGGQGGGGKRRVRAVVGRRPVWRAWFTARDARLPAPVCRPVGSCARMSISLAMNVCSRASAHRSNIVQRGAASRPTLVAQITQEGYRGVI